MESRANDQVLYAVESPLSIDLENNQTWNEIYHQLFHIISDNVKKLTSLFPYQWNDFLNDTPSYPHISFLQGYRGLGRLLGMLKEDGITNEILHKLGELSKQDKRGMAHMHIMNQRFLLITKPSEIHQVFQRNGERLSRSGAVKYNFSQGFGDHTAFTLPNGSEHKKIRNIFKESVFETSALEKAALAIPEIIDEFLQDAQYETKDLEQFFSSLTLEVMARTQLGATSVKKDSKKFTDAFHHVFENLYNHRNNLHQEIARHVHVKTNGLVSLSTPIDQARLALHDVVRDGYLAPNHDHIEQTDNLVTKLSKHFATEHSAEQADLNSETMVYQEALALLVGHDTVARLLQFSFMLLATHPDVFRKLRHEVDENVTEWTKESIEKLPYLSCVIKEVLRLYPGAPILAHAIEKPFMVANVPRTKDRAEYDKKFEERDVSQDIHLNEHDVVLIIPYLTNRNPETFPEPEKFKPERFENAEIDECAYIPFGIGPRGCIGQRFARLEASFALAKFVKAFNFELIEKVSHPFEINMLGTLRAKHTVHGFFKPREEVAELPVEEINLQTGLTQ